MAHASGSIREYIITFKTTLASQMTNVDFTQLAADGRRGIHYRANKQANDSQANV